MTAPETQHELGHVATLQRTTIYLGDVEHNDDSLNAASQSVFHKSWTSVNAGAVAYVEHEVGL